MRIKIFDLFLAASLTAPVMAGAALCDDTYFLQSAAQTVWEGTDAKALQFKEAKTIPPSFAGLQAIDNVMRYTLITGFEGACSKAAKPVFFKTKGINATAFKDSADNDYMVQMYDSNTIVNGHKFDYWFGFYKPAASLKFYLGRANAQSQAFVGWYVGIYFTDSTRDAGSGLWKETGHFYDLQGPDDSLTLEKEVLDQTIRKQPANGDSYRAHYKVHFFKVSYENKPTTAVHPARRAAPSGFRAGQTGNLVLIQPGDKSVGGQPLALYGMLGTKIATLHPTGFAYQWNGKTAVGADAPAGVYFVQAGNRVLGKFFYSR